MVPVSGRLLSGYRRRFRGCLGPAPCGRSGECLLQSGGRGANLSIRTSQEKRDAGAERHVAGLVGTLPSGSNLRLCRRVEAPLQSSSLHQAAPAFMAAEAFGDHLASGQVACRRTVCVRPLPRLPLEVSAGASRLNQSFRPMKLPEPRRSPIRRRRPTIEPEPCHPRRLPHQRSGCASAVRVRCDRCARLRLCAGART